jgi:hypothetical protein
MLDTQRIKSWLDSIPDIHDTFSDVYDHAHIPNNKTRHKRKAAQQEPSPPASDQDSNAMDGTTPKRRRLVDPNRTPRAVDFPPPASSNGSSMSWSESGDGASRSNSPKKQMLGLRLEERGLECRQLNIDTAPHVVAGLLDTI